MRILGLDADMLCVILDERREEDDEKKVRNTRLHKPTPRFLASIFHPPIHPHSQCIHTPTKPARPCQHVELLTSTSRVRRAAVGPTSADGGRGSRSSPKSGIRCELLGRYTFMPFHASCLDVATCNAVQSQCGRREVRTDVKQKSAFGCVTLTMQLLSWRYVERRAMVDSHAGQNEPRAA